MTAAAEAGLKDHDRWLNQRTLLARKLDGRRATSKLPALLDYVLSRPIASAGMIAAELKITPRAAQDLVAELGAFADNLAEFQRNMKIDTLHIGMKVRHPQYGVGTVKSLTEQTAEILFDDAPRTIAPASSDLQPAEATATLSELQMPLANLIHDTAHAVVEALGLEQKDVLVEGLATRWQRGTLVMQSADPSLQPKEVPLETFFHKIVMIRNNLRVLEQKVNASDKLSDADKFDLQQYITRCYGSLTTFNILFKNKDDQFRTSA